MKFTEEDIDALINNKPFNYIRSFQTQQEEETMNDNLNTPTEFKLVPLTDAEVEKLLELKPDSNGGIAYVTDADETDDGLANFGPETNTTIH